MNRHYLYDAHLKEDVPALLEMLKRKGLRMCVATGTPREYAKNGLSRLGILDYFEFVTDNYESTWRKDQPKYFDWVAGRMDTTPERCIVFEDALYAMESAKAAGCYVLAIEEGTARNQKERIMQVADWYVHGYAELLNDIA